MDQTRLKSLKPEYLAKLAFSAEQMAALQKLGEHKGKQDLFTAQTPEVLESMKQVALIESSESSNRLEGITAPHARIKAMVLREAAPRDRSEQEIAGYRDALALIHESAEHMAFSENIILQMHTLIYRYHASEGGKWKATNNEIVEKNPDGSIKRVRFVPVSAVETPAFMAALTEGYRETIDHYDPLIAIPLVVLDFLCIHPFRDGNGRVARLLTLMLLYHFGYQVGRYISLERIFEESKETYYETLEASSQQWHEGEHNVMPWLNYFWGTLLRAYDEFAERVGSIQSGKGSKSELVRQAVMRRIKPFSISDIEGDCPGVSRDMIRLVLRQIRDESLIASTGKGRGAKWFHTKE
jgi:Fic family protein